MEYRTSISDQMFMMCLISRFNRHFSRTFVTVFPLIWNYKIYLYCLDAVLTILLLLLRCKLRTFAPKSSHVQIFLKLLLQVENDKIRLKKKKKSGVTDLVLKIRRITDHSISRISSHSRRLRPDSLLSAFRKQSLESTRADWLKIVFV